MNVAAGAVTRQLDRISALHVTDTESTEERGRRAGESERRCMQVYWIRMRMRMLVIEW